MQLQLYISLLFILALGVIGQTTTGGAGGITTEVIVISIVNNVTVTATDTVTKTETVTGQAGATTSRTTSRTNSTMRGSGTGGLRPTGNITMIPVRGQAVPTNKAIGSLISLLWLALGFLLFG